MFLIKTTAVILLPAAVMSVCVGCTRQDTNAENFNMELQVYTLGVWHVRAGKQKAFITAWNDLGVIFASLPDPPGKGVLIQSTSDSTLFYSFGPWNSLEAVNAMRNDSRAQEGIRKLIALCTEATPGSYRVVAESP